MMTDGEQMLVNITLLSHSRAYKRRKQHIHLHTQNLHDINTDCYIAFGMNNQCRETVLFTNYIRM